MQKTIYSISYFVYTQTTRKNRYLNVTPSACQMARNTTAERSKAYRERIKSDPLKYQEFPRKITWKKKEQGVVKSVTELTHRKKRRAGRQWLTAQQNRRRKMEALAIEVKSFMAGTTRPEPKNCIRKERAKRLQRRGQRSTDLYATTMKLEDAL